MMVTSLHVAAVTESAAGSDGDKISCGDRVTVWIFHSILADRSANVCLTRPNFTPNLPLYYQSSDCFDGDRQRQKLHQTPRDRSLIHLESLT